MRVCEREQLPEENGKLFGREKRSLVSESFQNFVASGWPEVVRARIAAGCKAIDLPRGSSSKKARAHIEPLPRFVAVAELVSVPIRDKHSGLEY